MKMKNYLINGNKGRFDMKLIQKLIIVVLVLSSIAVFANTEDAEVQDIVEEEITGEAVRFEYEEVEFSDDFSDEEKSVLGVLIRGLSKKEQKQIIKSLEKSKKRDPLEAIWKAVEKNKKLE